MFALPPPILQPPDRYVGAPALAIVMQVALPQLAAACGLAHLDGRLLGCALTATDGTPCIIVLPTPETWPGTRRTEDLVRQHEHEQGHCNGWPSNHPN